MLGALALGLGTIVLSDYMRPSKRLERKQQKHEEMIRVAQEKEKAELKKRQQIEKELERKRKEEEQRRLELKRKEEYAKSKGGRFETVMDYYEGRNGKNMDLYTAFTMFHELVKEGYAPAMNAVACMYYHGEDPGQSRFVNGNDLALTY